MDASIEPDEDSASNALSYEVFISYSHAADGLLAPRLQAGLQKFAKPWWKRRAIRVFRDESSLSANPHLWSSITDALDESEWFVLLLSPDAAQSEWVNQEIEYWTEHKGSDRILPVVTEGEFNWRGCDIFPPALTFTEEPRWVDLRFAQQDEHLDLNHPEFRNAIADIASAVREIPKDDLASEEVRQHRRTIRTAWVAGVVVLLLGVAAAIGAVIATNESSRANEQADIAAAEADRANVEAERADEEADAAIAAASDANEARNEAEAAQSQAETERDRADGQARRATGEALAAQALNLVDRDPELALLLAVQSLTVDPGGSGISTAYAALLGDRQVFEITTPGDRAPIRGVVLGGLHPDGHLLAVAAAAGNEISVHNVDTGTPLWNVSLANEEVFNLSGAFNKQLTIENLAFSTDGASLVATITTTEWDFTRPRNTQRSNAVPDFLPDSQVAELRFYDAGTGEQTQIIELPECHELRHFPGVQSPYFDQSGPLLVSLDSDCDLVTPSGTVIGLVDLSTGTLTSVVATDANRLTPGVPTSNATATRVAYTDETHGAVVDVESGGVVFEFDMGLSTLSADGSRLLITNPATGVVELWDVDRSTPIWPTSLRLGRAWFSSDESLIYGTTDEGSAVILDASSGLEIFRVSGHGGTVTDVSLSVDGSRLATFGNDGTARVWQVSALDALPVVQVHERARRHSDLMIDRSGLVAVAWLTDEPNLGWHIRVFDPHTGETIRDIDGGSPALSDDGAVLAYLTVAPVDLDESQTEGAGTAGRYGQVGDIELIELDSGTVVGEIETHCNPYLVGTHGISTPGCNRDDEPGTAPIWEIELSPDGRFLAMNDGTHDTFTIWELESGARGRDSDGGRATQHIAFSPDSTLVATHYQDLETCFVAVFDAAGLATHQDQSPRRYTAFIELDGKCATAMEFTPDGAALILGNTRGGIEIVSTRDWTTTAVIDAHQGSGVEHLAINQAGTVMASSGFDGLRVWDLDSFALLAAIAIDASGGVAFLDDTHLLMLPRSGTSAVRVTLDTSEVRSLLVDRLTRSFTATECQTYRIDPCPTLEEIRGG